MMLIDRIDAIRKANERFNLLDNSYLSFSGGKDSTIVHYLLDEALPGNNIPRVFIDTGIEFAEIRNFVLGLARKDPRFIILAPSVPIKRMLEEEGYPFKSKEFSRCADDYQKRKELIGRFANMSSEEVKEYMLTHKEYERTLLGRGVFVIYFLHDIRAKRNKEGLLLGFDDASKFKHPKQLEPVFNPDFPLKISNICCQRLKKDPVKKWQKENRKSIAITGLRRDEGGRRQNIAGCIITDSKGNPRMFHPLLPTPANWETWYAEARQIEFCKLYYPPFNFRRTGCKGCPYALDLQEQLDLMEEHLPQEKRQCEIIWKPVYDEYRKLNYRLKGK